MRTTNPLKNQKYLSIFILIFILLLGAFFRLYRIREYMIFLGDEGRDALIVKRIIIDHKFTLLGPITSVGSMYMGPIYYYFMVPFLWLWHFDPAGPAVMVALFSIAAIFLLYKLGSDFFHPFTGLASAFLYAISPFTISYGRSSWNPNIVPLFSLLVIYSILRSLVKHHYNWLIIAGLSLGVLFQLHYATFIFIPVVVICFLFIRSRIPLRNILYGFSAFVLSYAPFLLFELRHQFVNTKGVLRFIFEPKNGSDTQTFFTFINAISDITVRIFWRPIIIENALLTKVFILALIIVLTVAWKKLCIKRENCLSVKVLILWLGVGISLFGCYQGPIYDYYFLSFFAVPFILTGLGIFMIWQNFPMGRAIALIILVILGYFNLKSSPLWSEPNNLVKNTQEIARFVFEKTQARPYNFALIAGKNSDHAYRYFLELWKRPPVIIETPANDPLRNTVTTQLFVVCEEKICQPLGHPLWEIAGFGRAEIDEEWQVSTARVFRLTHFRQ